jgi:hypothetical protein
MAFDTKAVLADMASAIQGVVTKDWPKLRTCAKEALEDERQALESLAKSRLAGEIDDDELKSEVADEKDTLKAALLSCEVGAKVTAQKAANAALKVFSDAIKLALKL